MSSRAEHLYHYLRGLRAKRCRIQPSSFDCAFFAARWVQLCTGRDLGAEWRGQYRSFDQGRALLGTAGYEDLGDLVGAHLDEINGWVLSAPGDIAALSENGQTALGIIGGPQIHVLSLQGLDYVPLDRAQRVFRP